jgi:pyrroloquinoline quinone biosynthesis protein B
MFTQFTKGSRCWKVFANEAPGRVPVIEAPLLNVDAHITPGLLPSYAGGHAQAGATTAFTVEHSGKRLVYAPIFLRIDENLKNQVQHADVVLLDGTCWSDEEMIELGMGTRRSTEMGHAPIAGPGGSLAHLGNVHARHRYYTHVNNSNPVLDSTSPQARELAKAGWAVAPEGLEIDL